MVALDVGCRRECMLAGFFSYHEPDFEDINSKEGVDDAIFARSVLPGWMSFDSYRGGAVE